MLTKLILPGEKIELQSMEKVYWAALQIRKVIYPEFMMYCPTISLRF